MRQGWMLLAPCIPSAMTTLRGLECSQHRWLSEHAAAQHEHPKLPKLFLFYEEAINKGYFHGNWSSSARTQRAFISAFISHIKS